MNTLLHGRHQEDDVDDRNPRDPRNNFRTDSRHDSRSDSRHDRSESLENRDREITLGTTMVVGIFFALAVLCAAFFGFGYSTGRQSALSTAAIAQAGGSASTFGGFKPAPGSPAGNLAAGSQTPTQTVTVPFTPMTPQAVAPLPPRPLPPAQTVLREAPAEPVTADIPARPLPRPEPRPEPAASAPLAAPAGAGQSMVQVAAVSHQEDADLLVTTLRRRGYAVAVHREPADSLMHVQIGPFSSRKEADGMRQRLLADGFNAIVK